MPFDPLLILSGIAVVLIGSLIGGRLATLCRLPRVTGYLLVGLLMGPSFARLTGLPELISSTVLSEMRVLSDVALMLILVNIGGQFQAETLRRWGRRIAFFSLAEIGLTFSSVALLCGLINQFVVGVVLPGQQLWQTSLFFGIFLGIIAVATAPAATLMVIREYEADGPTTSTVLSLVGLNNLFSIFAFGIAAHFLLKPTDSIGQLLYSLFVPLLIGGGLGFLISIWAERLELPSEFKILILSGVAFSAAISFKLGLDPLLTGLSLGIVLANSSPRWYRMQDALREVDYPLYVVFFVIAGANLHIESLAHIGLLGVAYVLARTIGKFFGAVAGAKLGKFGGNKGRHVGMTLLSQAGVAIGLASYLVVLWPEGGPLLQTIILGAVIVFELIGPLAVRHGLVLAGEVPIISLLQKRAPLGTMEGLHHVVDHFRGSLGLPTGHKLDDPGDILVKHIMRRNVETVRNNTRYNELLRLIAHSRYDRFPVVDDVGHYIGMIDYAEISSLLFEPSLAQLVVASDLAAPTPHTVGPDETLREAMQTLQMNRNISFFPVTDPDKPQELLGILGKNDVFAAFRRLEIG
jgi:Kef-type K+ transport system membrane component KefB/predicted transcriptional regulator